MTKRKTVLPPQAADVQPRGGRLLVGPWREVADKVGSLWLPQQSEDWQRYLQWEIVAVGPDVQDEALLPGARILVTRFSGATIELEGQPHAFIDEESVIAVLFG